MMGRIEAIHKEKCNCTVLKDETGHHAIYFCYVHQAAHDLLKAAKELLGTPWYGNEKTHRASLHLEMAIQKAEGKAEIQYGDFEEDEGKRRL